MAAHVKEQLTPAGAHVVNNDDGTSSEIYAAAGGCGCYNRPNPDHQDSNS